MVSTGISGVLEALESIGFIEFLESLKPLESLDGGISVKESRYGLCRLGVVSRVNGKLPAILVACPESWQ